MPKHKQGANYPQQEKSLPPAYTSKINPFNYASADHVVIPPAQSPEYPQNNTYPAVPPDYTLTAKTPISIDQINATQQNNSRLNATDENSHVKGLEQFENIDCITIKQNGERFEISLHKDGARGAHMKLISSIKNRTLPKIYRTVTLGYLNKDVDIDFKIDQGAKTTIFNIRRKFYHNEFKAENVYTIKNMRNDQIIGYIKPINNRQVYLQSSDHSTKYKMSCKTFLVGCNGLYRSESSKNLEKQIYELRVVDMKGNKPPRKVVGKVCLDESVGNTLQFDEGYSSEVRWRVLALAAEICFFVDSA